MARPDGVYFSQLLEVGDHRDDEGRPLGENKVLRLAGEQVPVELRRCPYPGSRHEHPKPMNVSALQQMIRHWPRIVGALGWLRARYVEGPGELSLLAFWRVAQAGALVPSYLLLHGAGPFREAHLPAWVAGLYKASLGLYETSQLMMIHGSVTGECGPGAVVTAEAVLAFADRNQVVVGQHEVCAGPANLIRGAARAITLEPAEVATSEELGELIGDLAPFQRYVSLVQKINLASLVLPLASRQLTAGLEDDPELPTELRRGLRELDAGRTEVGRVLDALGATTRQRCLSEMAGLATTIDGDDALERAIVAGLAPDDRWTRGLSELMDERIARALGAHLRLEAVFLGQYTALQAEVNRVLGRGPAPRGLTGTEITRAVGRTLRDAVTDGLSLDVETRPGEGVVRRGPRTVHLSVTG